jgi:hypothetical protein
VDNAAYVTITYSHLAELAARHSYVSTSPKCAVVTHHTTDT